jgi:CubicO group peptidase (beta-lactamase class C family)
MEQAAGKPFLDLVREQVLAPLRLDHTEPDRLTPIVAHRARPYARTQDGAIQNAIHVDNSNKWAGGGFLSTADDLVAFGSALIGSAFLKQETASAMFTPARTAAGAETPYGFGVRLEMKDGRVAFAHHGGSSIGGRGFLYLEPKSGVAIALLANMFCTIDEKDARALADLYR